MCRSVCAGCSCLAEASAAVRTADCSRHSDLARHAPPSVMVITTSPEPMLGTNSAAEGHSPAGIRVRSAANPKTFRSCNTQPCAPPEAWRTLTGSLAVAARTGALPSGAMQCAVRGRPFLKAALGCRAAMRLAIRGLSVCLCLCPPLLLCTAGRVCSNTADVSADLRALLQHSSGETSRSAAGCVLLAILVYGTGCSLKCGSVQAQAATAEAPDP